MRLKRYPSYAGPNAPRLLCFPYGGGGISVFNTWPRLLPQFEIWSVELPGRDSQIRLKPFVSFPPLIAELQEVLRPVLDRPHFYFGHSLGALIAFELARAVFQSGDALTKGLIVSAHPAPHLPSFRKPLHQLSEPDLIQALRELNGTPKAVFQHAELLDLMLPLLRADFELHFNYEFRPQPPLPVPIVAFAGTRDAEVMPEDMKAWKEHTTAAFEWHPVEGDHFFLSTAAERFLPALQRALARLLTGAPARAGARAEGPSL